MQRPISDFPTVPDHVALIMDGNRRWARARNRSQEVGYKAGIQRAKELIPHAVQRGIDVLTLFAFSSENRSRPKAETDLLMRLFSEALGEYAGELREQGARLRFLGDLDRLPESMRLRAEKIQAQEVDPVQITVCVAMHYGGRQDLLRAFARCRGGGELDEKTLSAALDTGGLPDPDLLIRTGGESRLSNFLLWQTAYTELYFTDCLWPDFGSTDFDAALLWYAQRERRFGGGAQDDS